MFWHVLNFDKNSFVPVDKVKSKVEGDENHFNIINPDAIH